MAHQFFSCCVQTEKHFSQSIRLLYVLLMCVTRTFHYLCPAPSLSGCDPELVSLAGLCNSDTLTGMSFCLTSGSLG